MPSEFGMSPRQHALARDLADSDGPRVSLDPPESNKPALNDEQVAATCARVFVWVFTGKQPGDGGADDGWFAVAQLLRTMFAGEADPPAIHTDQLIDLLRAAHGRALRLAPSGPLGDLPVNIYAAWRATARHGYNCVIAERDALRETTLDERERMMVRGALETMGQVPPELQPLPPPPPPPPPAIPPAAEDAPAPEPAPLLPLVFTLLST